MRAPTELEHRQMFLLINSPLILIMIGRGFRVHQKIGINVLPSLFVFNGF